MRRVCAWCKKELTEGQSQTHEITHGICEFCRVSLLSSRAPRPLYKYLNYFSLPILMVDAGGHVVSANQTALSLVGKRLDEITNVLGGNVMSCKYAFQEEGCGETVHCVACTIKNSVISTYETGESFHRVPANLLVEKDGQDVVLSFLISTEKVAEAVLLQIDEVLS